MAELSSAAGVATAEVWRRRQLERRTWRFRGWPPALRRRSRSWVPRLPDHNERLTMVAQAVVSSARLAAASSKPELSAPSLWHPRTTTPARVKGRPDLVEVLVGAEPDAACCAEGRRPRWLQK